MILIFGGTSDSLKLAESLEKTGYDYYLSVATAYGKELAEQKAKRVIEGRLDQEAMEKFIREKQIQYVIDATHPYALEVSRNIMSVVSRLDLPYLRYERASLLDQVKGAEIHIVNSTSEACKLAHDIGTHIFLGTGSKSLPEFVSGLKEKKIVARVLPVSEVILQCEALGLSPENIIAMKGPFSKEMNKALYRHYDIDCMITKESGKEGGFLEKIDACIEEGIQVIIIKRETLNYPRIARTVEEVVETIINEGRK